MALSLTARCDSLNGMSDLEYQIKAYLYFKDTNQGF